MSWFSPQQVSFHDEGNVYYYAPPPSLVPLDYGNVNHAPSHEKLPTHARAAAHAHVQPISSTYYKHRTTMTSTSGYPKEGDVVVKVFGRTVILLERLTGIIRLFSSLSERSSFSAEPSSRSLPAPYVVFAINDALRGFVYLKYNSQQPSDLSRWIVCIEGTGDAVPFKEGMCLSFRCWKGQSQNIMQARFDVLENLNRLQIRRVPRWEAAMIDGFIEIASGGSSSKQPSMQHTNVSDTAATRSIVSDSTGAHVPLHFPIPIPIPVRSHADAQTQTDTKPNEGDDDDLLAERLTNLLVLETELAQKEAELIRREERLASFGFE